MISSQIETTIYDFIEAVYMKILSQSFEQKYLRDEANIRIYMGK